MTTISINNIGTMIVSSSRINQQPTMVGANLRTCLLSESGPALAPSQRTGLRIGLLAVHVGRQDVVRDIVSELAP